MALGSNRAEITLRYIRLKKISKQQLHNQIFVSILFHVDPFRFEHPKERVNIGKRKVNNDMREETRDMCIESL